MRKSLLASATLNLAGLLPNTQRGLWRWWYDQLAQRDKRELLLMNYGYCNDQLLELDEDLELYRYPLQLYRHVIKDLDLQGKTLLEAGCGRGGGLRYLHTSCKPEQSLGMDISSVAMQRAQNELATKGLRYVCADVQKMPIGSNTIDVVLNVESSHCYPSFRDFIQEVSRVLKPQGYFCFADFRAKGDVALVERDLSHGLDLQAKETINDAVIRALDKVAEERRAKIANRVPAWIRLMFSHFVALPGTVLYKKLQSGDLVYLVYRMRKP